MTAKNKVTHSTVTAVDNERARALLALMSTTIELVRDEAPDIVIPEMPESYPQVQRGIERMTAQFIDPARAEGRRTSADDVETEFLTVLSNAQDNGFDFAELAKVLTYRKERDQSRSLQDSYVRSSSARAERLGEQVREWLQDLLDVLAIRDVVGVGAVKDAAEASNKTLAAVALDLMVREKSNAAAASELNTVAAGRGLMTLAQAGIAPADLQHQDLEQVAALAGFASYPEGLKSFGQCHTPLSIRVGHSVLQIDAQAAVLYSEATTPQQGTTLLPRTALVAASEAALVTAQKMINNELAGTPHRFHDMPNDGNSSLDTARRRMYGGNQ
ncbi:hypothetical protein V2K16_00570 [Pseudomonas alliivorans]|uniref:hypothetical protein n=1 Tax=Pseudomonas alliivorans TaxID=2810613 RepID=UPI001AE7C22F|nr:hypothetical protein [Pseudomonas alliivorans]MBP0938719.1 hypothetical protein [Pseudomonas alliivorans]MEE4878396.1 hypothetical protein [Pseudomonas alliivorans]MEE4928152.1 hypothetical protein [Pseudomonas alliivorans]MEE4933566.1 hypothetical protein [Pseudomonas alliivorans]MEE4938698.1 hypothetical protein [Pseudomonas alliivorans]